MLSQIHALQWKKQEDETDKDNRQEKSGVFGG